MNASEKAAESEYAQCMAGALNLVRGVPLEAKEVILASMLVEVILCRVIGRESISLSNLEDFFRVMGIDITAGLDGKNES